MFFMREATKSKASFNEVTFEAELFTIDTEARCQVMEVEEVESSLKDDRKACKLVIRQRISELMEGKNFAQNPRHVHHRIPNFVLLLMRDLQKLNMVCCGIWDQLMIQH